MRLPRASRTVAAVALAAVLAGCATTANYAPSKADPFDPFNRVRYAIGEPIDTNIVRPIAQAWVDYVPTPIQSGVRTFFGNIEDGFSAFNSLLQGKWEKAGNDLGRVTVNIWGFGFVDMPDNSEADKAINPLIGPTTFRDGTGLIIRAYLSPVYFGVEDVALRNVLWFMGALDLRVQALEATDLVDRAAIDKYTFIRRAYLQRREYQVYDGNPPRKDDDE